MSTITTQDAIKAATSVARDIADGGLSPSELEGQAVAECRELFGTVAGPDDPLWDLHCNIARQVLALDGVSADELAEWLAVARQRAGEAVDPTEPPESAVPSNVPIPTVSSASGEASGSESLPEAEPEPQPVLEAVPQPRADTYDPLAGWSPAGSRTTP